jgi:hypothetical protein
LAELHVGCAFDLQTGAIGTPDSGITPRIEALPNDWYRLSITGNADANTTIRVNINTSLSSSVSEFVGDVTSGILLWGAQLETGSVATSYIKTEGSAQTRNADVITDDLTLPQTSGIFTATLNNRLITGTRTIATLRGASTTWPVELRNNRFGFRDVVQGADTTAGTHRVGVWWADSGATYRLYVDGALIGTEQTGATPISGTIGTFDYGMNNSTNWLNDALSEIAVISGGTPTQAQTLITPCTNYRSTCWIIESLTGSQQPANIHNCVQLGHVTEVEGTDETPPVLSERFHTDIMSEAELTLPDGITRHYPTSPVHGFAGL